MKLPLLIILPVLLGVAGAGAGVGARLVLGAAAPAPASGEALADASGAPGDAKKDHAPSADEGHANASRAKGHGKEEKSPAPHYFKFSRQFVVPVLIDGAPRATMALDVLIEMKPGVEDLYSNEPALRDAVLRALLRKTSEGALSRIFAEPALMEGLRGEILAEVAAATGGAAQSVLILDIGYQSY